MSTVTAIGERLLRLGADPADDEETRLDKLLVLSGIAMIAPLATLWGAGYAALGAPRAAAIPWLYVALTIAGVAAFAVHRSLRLLALSQLVPYVLLPFVLMWVLGGFVSGSAVALWAALAPLAALVVSGARAAVPWLAAFLALLVASVFVDVDGGDHLPSAVVEAFFVLNISAVTIVAFGLVAVLHGGRDAAMDAVRALVRRYFSPAVASRLLTDPRRLELGGEIAEVTVLFADLRGFTAAIERLAPEAAVELVNRYFGIALPAVEAEGGTPIQLAGDEVMAIFNAPERQPDHVLRAVRAAVEIQAKVADAVRRDDDPRFGIGINTGPALVGNIGSASYFNFTAIGDATNLAARLTDEAGAGEILLGPSTAAALGPDARITARTGLRLKGKSGSTTAYVLDAGGSPPTGS